ncbi:Sensory box histidine kinase/response regulator [Olavius sp. associated proteobacterium Delta 1]|nr:Sensory box histidine kinase/response regulator [Olavius sp. associated proteobacterium Delta 1]
MKDIDKTKKQLLDEIADLRQKIKDFDNTSSNRPEKIHPLKHNDELYRTLVEQASEAILVIQNNKIRYANTRASEFTGYSRKELSDRPLIDLIHPDDRKQITFDDIQIRDKAKKPEVFTCRITRKNDDIRWLETKLLNTTVMTKPAILCFLNDVTERKIAEKALQQSEGRYQLLVDHAPAGIYEIDLTNGQFISSNDVMCQYTGYTKEEFLNLNFTDLLTQESLEKNLARYQKIQNREAVPDMAEYEIIGKNQRRLWILVNTSIKYENDTPVSVTVIAHDITNRKHLEQERSKAQKLESLGVLAGGIGHDFNNLLSGIMGNISLAKLEAERGENIMESLNEALRVAAKASALTRQLLVFSKGGAPVRKAASIAEVLKESTAFTLRGSKVRCKFNITENLWPVKVDIGQFSQVINNLVINAMQSMSSGGEIRLIADNITIEKILGLPLIPGRYVVIKIQDPGEGISQINMPQIFDPYFTTKSKGSGLGLTMTYTTIKRHDGHITVDSEVGRGTTFTIYLPATEEEPEKAGDQEALPAGGDGRILVMDDEETLRKVAARMLLELGYEVHCVPDGAEAIKQYKQAQESGLTFDAVIMDLTIPGGMGGKEAIEKLLEIDPQAKAVVSSGYSNDPIMSNFKKFGFKGVVAKPYRIEELSWILRDVLNSG